MAGKAGYDKETAELMFAADKSLRGRYARGVERCMGLVSQMLTLMATGPDNDEQFRIRQMMISMIEKFYEDMKRECYEIHPLEEEWLKKLKKRLPQEKTTRSAGPHQPGMVIGKILANPENAPIPTNERELETLCFALAKTAKDPVNHRAIFIYQARLPAEFEILCFAKALTVNFSMSLREPQLADAYLSRHQRLTAYLLIRNDPKRKKTKNEPDNAEDFSTIEGIRKVLKILAEN